MENVKKCADCNYCNGLKRHNATRYGFHCEHPDKQYIIDYFRKNNIRKMDGFIGFGKPYSQVPEIKTSPAWCLLRRKEGERL